MSKKLVATRNGINVYRYKSGIAIAESSTDCGSAHPNIHKSGSVRGMKNKGFWGKDDQTKQAGQYIYNISIIYCSTELDKLAKEYCQCGNCQ